MCWFLNAHMGCKQSLWHSHCHIGEGFGSKCNHNPLEFVASKVEPDFWKVTVCETWVISIKLMKRPGTTTNILHQRGSLLEVKYKLEP